MKIGMHTALSPPTLSGSLTAGAASSDADAASSEALLSPRFHPLHPFPPSASEAAGVGGLLPLLLLFLFFSCKPQPEAPVHIPVYGRYLPPGVAALEDSTLVYAVIEVPAGTAQMQALDTTMEIRPTAEAPVDFLPFPGNYGFVAGCAITDTINNTVAPLPVMVMMPALSEGSVVAVRPVAALMLTQQGIPYPVIVAVPADTALQSIRVHAFVDLMTEYDAARQILQHWFLNYRGRDAFDLTGWRDERYALHLIAQWKITQ